MYTDRRDAMECKWRNFITW